MPKPYDLKLAALRPVPYVPNKGEIRFVLEQTRKLMGMSWTEMSLRLGLKQTGLLTLLGPKRPLGYALALEIREKVNELVAVEFDPLSPQARGLEREWYALAVSARDFVRGNLAMVIPDQGKPFSPRMLKSLERRRTRVRYVE